MNKPTLFDIISLKNRQLVNIRLNIQSIEYRLSQLTDEHLKDSYQKMLKSLRFNRWQFFHDYATELSDYVIQNVDSLNRIDASDFDLVPYTVWNKMTEKSRRVIINLDKDWSNNESN